VRRTNIRYFWDWGISANTTLREAVLSHRRYWTNVRTVDHIPGLKIAILNLHPHKQEYLPPDYDADRTQFDEYVGVLIADLQVLSKSLIKIVEGESRFNQQLQKLLQKKSKSFRLEDDESMTYNELIDGIVVERKNDFNTLSNKTFDFSKITIDRLIDDGYRV
jgi:NTE family protein